MIDRRNLLSTGMAMGAASLFAPTIAFARAATNKHFVFIIQRGAADGLGIVAPIGDPAYSGLRGDLATDFAAAPRLDSMFALHPALAQVNALYGQKQALFCHAVASPYRDRSHFDGQNVLETGGGAPYATRDGWINRMLPLLPASEAKALALAATIPPALRGSAEVGSYAPSGLPDAKGELQQRIAMLYGDDAMLHQMWETALQTKAMADADNSAASVKGAQAGEGIGKLAASLMQGPQGARVVMIETNGWDTHTGQRARLTTQLTALDHTIASLRDGLGTAWQDTLVVVATEFGRTAAANGTGGTDHGTGSMAMLMGGAVAGGRVVTDWPGLGSAQLYENRDLRPTQSVDAVIGGALAGHYVLDPAPVMARLFPGSTARAASGLISA